MATFIAVTGALKDDEHVRVNMDHVQYYFQTENEEGEVVTAMRFSEGSLLVTEAPEKIEALIQAEERWKIPGVLPQK